MSRTKKVQVSAHQVGPDSANQVGVRVMYVLYKYDKFSRLKEKYKFDPDTFISIRSKSIRSKDDKCSLINIFKDPKYEQENHVLYTEPIFYIDGNPECCNGTWYDESKAKGNPNINILKSVLDECYNNIFSIEKIGKKWIFNSVSEDFNYYLNDVSFKKHSKEPKEDPIVDFNFDEFYEIDNKNNEKEMDTIESQSTTVTTPNNIFGRNIILYGAPGTGKSHTAQQIVKNNAKDDKTCKELKLDNMPAGKSVRVTFHPDTDYASFVGCYKPSMNGKEIEYKFVPQAFLKIYVDAWKSLILKEKKQYYLIIEELNRGNCAQIFGDIFQLLDRDDNGYSEYYILADTDVVKYLKSEEGFGNNYEKYCGELKDLFEDLKKDDNKDWDVLALPCNLTILATMNTSDQSLFPIDSAFKRRWEWKYVRINYDAVDLKDVKLWNGTTKWLDFIEAINKYIADKTHSADKQIGERFIKKPKDSKIDYETFRDKVMFYLFNDVFKDDESFGKDVFEDENGIHLFGDLTEENAKKFIKNKLLVQ